MKFKALVLAVALAFCGAVANAVTLNPGNGATPGMDSLFTSGGSTGSSTGVFYGIDDLGIALGENVSSFAEFDITGTGIDIPIGATITSATLNFDYTPVGGTTYALSWYYSPVSLAADGTITSSDVGEAGSTIFSTPIIPVSGSNFIDVAFELRQALGAAVPSSPSSQTTLAGVIGFRWNGVLGPGTITGAGNGTNVASFFGAEATLDVTLGSALPPTAEANGPYDFGGGTPNLSENFSSAGSQTNPSGGGLTYDWDFGGPSVSTAANPPITLAQTGLTQPGDSTTVNLEVTDTGNSLTGTDTATVTYTNNAPTADADPVTTAVYQSTMALATTRSFTAAGTTDLDLAMNTGPGSVAGFEVLSYTWSFGQNTSSQINAISLSDAFAQGLSPNNPVNLNLTVSDNDVTPDSDSIDTPLQLTYQNATPTATGPSAVDDGSGGFDISVNVNDVDFAYFATLFNGYDEGLNVQAWATGGGPDISLGPGQFFATTGGLATFNVPMLTYQGLLSSGYTQFFFTATDSFPATGTSSLAFFVAPLATPEPGSIAIWSLVGLGLAGGFGYRRYGRKK